MSRIALLGAALLLGACTRDPASPGALGDRVERCRYDVSVASERPLVLDVAASCSGRGVRGLAAADAAIAGAVTRITSESGVVNRHGERFELPRARGSAVFRYAVDVEALAREESLDHALRRGRSMLLPASSFLLHPVPLDEGIESDVHVTTPPGFDFVTGLTRVGDHHRLGAHEIPVATYSVFGPRARKSVAIGGAVIDVAVLDGALAATHDEIGAWVDASARAVAAFYGIFPAPRAFVGVVPEPGRESVVFGKLLPESAPGIALLVGSRATAPKLGSDWVLVHELFHIGGPSFHGEGKWYDEGLATYFEPILRVRAGLYTERELWRELARNLPHGLAAFTGTGLENADDYKSLYWGGALFCLVSDVAIRARSHGRVGLEDGLRRVLDAGGHSSEVWSLAEALALADRAFPEPVLAPLAARHAARGAAFDLDALLRDLGVELGERDVVLRDDARLAWVRRAIVQGEPDPR